MNTTVFRDVDWYDEPHYYDILLENDTPLEARFLEAVLELHGRSSRATRAKEVLEPACGSGRLVVELARRGHSVSGFDRSRPMLDYARARLDDAGLDAELFVADMATFRVRRKYDLVYSLLSSFRYLLDEDDARGHLERVGAALRRGGLFVLGLHLSQYGYDGIQRERWVGARRGTRVVCNLQSWPVDRSTRTERLRSRLTVEARGATKRFETHWTFRTYDAAQLRRLLRSVPSLELVTTYDFDYDLEHERELDDEQQDCLLVLRKR